MTDRLFSSSGEKTGFANSSKSANKKYGSTNKKPVAAPHLANPQAFHIHQLLPSDTVQGLALRYGVTPELIKRFNKLYTNDSIHLKTCIKIPDAIAPIRLQETFSSHATSTPSSATGGVTPFADAPLTSGFLNPLAAPPRPSASPLIGGGVPPSSSFDAIIPGLSLPPPKRNSPVGRMFTSASTPEALNNLYALPNSKNPDGSSQFPLQMDDDDDKSVSSLLNKIDSMLLKSKEDVKEYEKKRKEFGSQMTTTTTTTTTTSKEEDDAYSYQAGSAFHYYPHGRASRSGHHKLRQEGYSDLDGSPELVIKGSVKRNLGKKNVSGTGRKGNHSGIGYGELEEEEDVIFEL